MEHKAFRRFNFRVRTKAAAFMKIAQISPLVESCPPTLYGGTERIVSYLTEALVADGHEVTLFATGDSVTDAELVAPHDVALRLDPAVKDQLPHQLMMLDEVKRRAEEFDILHFHTELTHFPVVREMSRRSVTTLHNRLDLPDLKPFYEFFSEMPLVSISYSQRAPMPDQVNWAGNVYHGLPKDVLPFTAKPKERYLAFIGRIAPEKGPDKAVEIATRSGMPLKIAAKIDAADRSYWDEAIQPQIAGRKDIQFVGEIGEAEKGEFLGNACGLLFPIEWPEPFGLVMIEAMACGTPVLAFDAGSVREVIDEGRTGFVVNGVEESLAAVRRLDSLDRKTIRETFERRFTVERMMRDYVEIYQKLLDQRRATSASIPMSATARKGSAAEPAGFPSNWRG